MIKAEYRRTRMNGKLVSLHRAIFFNYHGWWPDEVDHIDGNRYNNDINNLRAATRKQNTQNAKLRKDNVVGIKGISWHKASKKWRIQVRANKLVVCDKYVNDLELAELVAIEARNKYHGEFARHF